MPTYDFRCPNGHVTERYNIESDDHSPRTCPRCMKLSYREVESDGVGHRDVLRNAAARYLGYLPE